MGIKFLHSLRLIYMFNAFSTKSVVGTDSIELTAMENELMPYISIPYNSKAKE